jgi:hypothetical protein
MQATKTQLEEPAQYTIRGIPPEVDRELRKKAAKLKLSLNQLVVDELTRAAIGLLRLSGPLDSRPRIRRSDCIPAPN